MLTFSKTSWHYRLYSAFENREPRDFCSYVRSIVFALAISIFIICLGLLLSSAMLVSLLYLTDTLLGLFPDAWYGKDLGGMVGTGAFLWALLFVIFFGVQFKEWQDDRKYARMKAEWDAEREGRTLPEPEPSLFGEWYKSFKGKFCPRMEFV